MPTEQTESSFLRKRLCLRPVVQIVPIREDCWSVWVGGEEKRLEGRSVDLVAVILAHLSDTLTVAELSERVAQETGTEAPVVLTAIENLYRWALFDDAEGYRAAASQPPVPESQVRFFAMQSSRPYDLQRRIAQSRVALFGAQALVAPLANALATSGFLQVSIDADRPADLASADLVVLGTRSLASRQAVELNAQCVQQRKPLLAFGAEGARAFVGPFVLSRESACLACVVAMRRRVGMEPEENAADPIELEPTPRIAAELAAVELIRLATRAMPPALKDRQLVFEPGQFAWRRLDFWRLPRCATCGTWRDRSPVSAFELEAAHDDR